MKKVILFLFPFLAFTQLGFAQPLFCNLGQCLDTISPVNVVPSSNNLVSPVCGCNAKTYRNQNHMWNDNVCLIAYPGPCEDFVFYMDPSFITQRDLQQFGTVARFKIVSRFDDNLYFQISDFMGRMVISKNLPVLANIINDYSFELSGNLDGWYVVNVFSNNHQQFNKFVILN